MAYFSKFDRYQLERFVGTENYMHMVSEHKDKFVVFGE